MTDVRARAFEVDSGGFTKPKEIAMQAETRTGKANGMKRRTGRIEPDKQEAVIDSEVISNRKGELVNLHKAAETAGIELSEAIKKAAEDSGYNASTVRRFIAACAGENYEKAEKSAQQLALIFEEVGE